MGYFGVDLLFGQVAASMAPPTTARNDPAQAMKMAEPNSYLQEESNGLTEASSASTNIKQTCTIHSSALEEWLDTCKCVDREGGGRRAQNFS